MSESSYDGNLKGREVYFKGDPVVLTGEIEKVYGGQFALGRGKDGRELHISLEFARAQIKD